MSKKDTHLTQTGAEVQKILDEAQRVYIGSPNAVEHPDEGDICIVPAHDGVAADAFEYRNGEWVSRGGIDQAIAKAISAYQKPDTGIPASDLAIGVQASLDKADAAMPGITALPSPIVSSGDSLAKYVSTHLNDTGIYYFVWVGPLSDEDTAINSGPAYVFVFENESQSTVRLVFFGGTTASNLYTVTRSLSNVYSLKKFATMEDIPTNVGDLANNVGFITKSVDDLVNYYLKSETYTKGEVNSLINAIQGFSYVVVSELPSASAETMGIIYLLPSADPQTQNVKDEFIAVDNGSSAQTRYTWEQIGSTAIDLSGYVTDSDLSAALSDYTTTANLTTLLAGKQDVIPDLATIRSGAESGATAYQKPSDGIPETDLASAVQTSLGKANSAYQKPQTGIPSSDLADNVVPTNYAGSPSTGGPANKTFGIPFGAVDSTSTSTAFTATVDNFPTTLVDGVCAYVRNDVVSSAEGYTLDINGTGALPVYSSIADATRDKTIFTAARTFLFIYNSSRVDGGCWDLYYGMYVSDTDVIGQNIRGQFTLPVKYKTYRYRMLFESPDGTLFIPANKSTSTSDTAAKAVVQDEINPFGLICYYSYTTTINANAAPATSYVYTQYLVPLGYSFNTTGSALTLTAFTPVYLKCAPQANGMAIIDENTPFVQTLPTTKDGKIYIFLGIAKTETELAMLVQHPIYYHDGTNVRLWTAVEQAQSDWNQADTSAKDFIKNKPTIPEISTDIDTDAESDTKTASPKAVKTYVDAQSVTIDSTLSTVSENPVQNKAVKNALDAKLGYTFAGEITPEVVSAQYLTYGTVQEAGLFFVDESLNIGMSLTSEGIKGLGLVSVKSV